MDGWGHGQDASVSAIAQANTPFVDSLYTQVPNTELLTHGPNVGLPEGQMGNSEVGHLNIGAGRVVDQELQRINKAIGDQSFNANPALNQALEQAAASGGKLHMIGLLSDGGIHSHEAHLHAIIDLANEKGITQSFVHAFTDGRDTDPNSGLNHVESLLQHIKDTPTQLASISGRYYAMDRDNRWARVKLAYDALVQGEGVKVSDPLEGIRRSYEEEVTDEFIKPIICTDESGEPLARIEDGDTVICFNFRTDRCREITRVLTQEDMPAEGMHKLDLNYVTMTRYDQSFKGVTVIFENKDLEQTLGQVLAEAGKTQLRIAETEKYPHVTYFFNGGREEPFEGEDRIMIPSPKVATYDLQPEMSAAQVRDAVIDHMTTHEPDFICLNFANPDMVGHTGVFAAAVKAVETIDSCVQSVVKKALEHNYTIFLTADHGNCDFMVNRDGSVNTAHTMNPVPLFVIGADDDLQVRPGKLGDLAPSMLKVMDIAIPPAMTGEQLV
jgi:2,3-bisphosphoglycerate-independent phosphoglycerate mutase